VSDVVSSSPNNDPIHNTIYSPISPHEVVIAANRQAGLIGWRLGEQFLGKTDVVINDAVSISNNVNASEPRPQTKALGNAVRKLIVVSANYESRTQGARRHHGALG